MAPADFDTEAELVVGDVVGNDVGQHAGDVVATGGIGDSHLFKSADRHARRTEDGLPVNERVRAGEQTHGLDVEAVIRVIERLVEVINAKQNLSGHPRAKNGMRAGRAFLTSNRLLTQTLLNFGTL